MAETCRSGLSVKSITEYTPAQPPSLFKAVSNSAAETTCICSTQSWWHHPERCKDLVVRRNTTILDNVLLQAIRRSEIVRDQTKLIIFLGTPHRGSGYAGWGQIASNLARLALQDSNKRLLETLEVNSEVLDNIHEEFKTIAFKGTLKIHSFQEGQGLAGMTGLDAKVCLCCYMLGAADTLKSKADSCRWWTISRPNWTSREH